MSLSIQINPLFNTSLRHKNINPFIKTFTKEKPNTIQIEHFLEIHTPKINELTRRNEVSDTESDLKKFFLPLYFLKMIPSCTNNAEES
ncbi:hypothetical protein BJP41_04790 [Candidatus Williamhamiltonella defendens]|uniref:Uncharacterized protein n=1 Tax=Candidatus Williamhamiltonella defendens TaxID=138072 RepID=A0A2D3T7I5_9ENTR|nr:hypothetical protein [Candidatus Hamiltonella defensa]ATW29768.1 hypothetical protein BJP41_04790 [Candidatus Hamiltonella defensa]ATW31747.1 hypothetical protein BJP42_04865 [Candidatus Hamiltonella defensa]